MWAKRRNFSRLILGFYYMVTIGGIVASTSNIKKPFKYAIAIYLNVRFVGDATRKLRQISMHHDMSLTQTSQSISCYNVDPIILNTIVSGVRITVIHVII